MNFLKEDLKKRGLITSGFHLPYNPELVERAKELRKEMTPAERKLWYGYLRNFKYKVYRQRPIDHYIVDFYCHKLKLVIEIDGGRHFTTDGKEYDAYRTEVLQCYGLKILRFTNSEILKNFKGVCRVLDEITPL